MTATSTAPSLVESLSPTVRTTLLSLRLRAMQGEAEAVLTCLDDLIAEVPDDRPLDRLGLKLLKAELHHLDRRESEAVELLRRLSEDAAPLPAEYQFAVADNLAQAQMSALHPEGADTFYHLVDRWRAAGIDWYGKDEQIDVQSAFERGRYHEARAAVWRSLVRAYRIGSWRLARFAHERFCKLCVRIGALEEVCHYAVLAELDEKEMSPLAIALTARRDRELIRSVIARFLRYANLRRHFVTACGLLTKVADLIPDADVPAVGEWLLPRCAEPGDHLGGKSVMSVAWKLVRQIGPRFPAEVSSRLIDTAVTHPTWLAPLPGENRVLIDRDTIADAVAALVYAAPPDKLGSVVDQTLPLATDRLQDHDYPNVLNLLCHAVGRGGDELKRRVAAALYPPGKTVNRMLAQLDTVFGVDALTAEQWKRFANKVCDETRLLVQRVKPGEEPQQLPETLMTLNMPTDHGQLVVTTINGVGLATLAERNSKLDDETVGKLIRVLVEMAAERDNTLSNREMMLLRLSELAERADPDLRQEVVEALQPLASGVVLESEVYPTAAELNHPLRSSRFDGGSTTDVRTMALVAIAYYADGVADLEKVANEVISEALVDADATVRQGAYSGARRLHELPADGVLAVLMGLRDPDLKACIAAFAAVADRVEWPFTRPMWKLFLLATRLTCQSDNVNLRRHAAHALKARLRMAPPGSLKRTLEDFLQVLAGDAAYSVREVIADATVTKPT